MSEFMALMNEVIEKHAEKGCVRFRIFRGEKGAHPFSFHSYYSTRPDFRHSVGYGVRLGTYEVRPGIYEVRSGIYEVRPGTYEVGPGTYEVRAYQASNWKIVWKDQFTIEDDET